MKTKLILGGLISCAYFTNGQTGILVTSGTSGQSGLKFANFNNTSPLSPSSGNVLSVNASGDVILVPTGSGVFGGADNGCSAAPGNIVQLGNTVGGTQAQLTSNREVPQNGNYLWFSGNNANDRVGIGGTSSAPLGGRLTVHNTFASANAGQSSAIFAASNNYQSSINSGIWTHAYDFSLTQYAPDNYGVYSGAGGYGNQVGVLARAQSVPNSSSIIKGISAVVNSTIGSTGNGNTYGLDCVVSNHGSGTNYGVKIDAGSTQLANTAYGIFSGCAGAQNNYAGYFTTSGSQPPLSNQRCYGVYSYVNNGTVENFGIKSLALSMQPTCTNWAGWFEGDVTINGATPGPGFPNGGGTSHALNVNGTAYLSTGNLWMPSDRRFKVNVNKLSNIKEKISRINGYSYNFKSDEFKNKNFPKSEQFGVIAQELAEVFPQLVSEQKDGYLAINYLGLIPVLLEAIKDQQSQIDQLNLKYENSQLSKPMSLKDNETGELFQMSQNEPNPFTHETVVKYTLPATVSNAFMAVYDLTGKQITTFPIEQKGSASLTITSEKLAAGIYIYSIVADGKVVDSKRMILAEK